MKGVVDEMQQWWRKRTQAIKKHTGSEIYRKYIYNWTFLQTAEPTVVPKSISGM